MSEFHRVLSFFYKLLLHTQGTQFLYCVLYTQYKQMDHTSFLKLAVEEALSGMRAGEGGPFGAIIVRNGEIIGKGHNTVLGSNDPTAHAEVNAIRNACKNLGEHHLSGAVIYSNFEPCPMCLAAIYWAHIRTLYYSGGRSEAEKIGFMDSHLYTELCKSEDQREIKTDQIKIPEMKLLMKEWMELDGKNLY
jgi:guanine deaminase